MNTPKHPHERNEERLLREIRIAKVRAYRSRPRASRTPREYVWRQADQAISA